MRHTRPPQGCGAATPRSFRPHVAYAGFKRVYPRHAFSPHMGRFPKSITTGRAGAKQARLQRPPPEKRDACAFHMQDPFCLGRAFCGLPAGSVFSKCRLEYRARPQATPTACAGPVRACFWHTAQSAGLFPFPPARKPAAIVSAQGAALVTRRWQPAPPAAGAKAFYRPPLAAPVPQGHFALSRNKISGQGGKNCKPGRIQGKAAAGQNHNPRPRLRPA